MPSRLVVSIGYAGGSVGAEVDVVYVTEKVPSDSSPTGWRDPDGAFASPPEVSVEDAVGEAERVRSVAASNVKNPELGRELRNADLAVEEWERVEDEPTGSVQSTFRIDPDGDGVGWVEYDVDGGRLDRRDR